MINFMYQRDWTKGCQIIGRTLFLGVFVRVFLEGISIQIDELSQVLMRLGTLQSVVGPKRTKRGSTNLFLFAWSETSVFSCSRTSEFPVIGLSDSYLDLHHQSPILRYLNLEWRAPPAFLVLPLEFAAGTHGLLSLHSQVSHFPIINLCNCSVSLESSD